MDEKLIERLARDIANYLRMACSSDWTETDIARYLRMEYGGLDSVKEQFDRIGEAINDPISADFCSVATGVEKLAIRSERLELCLSELYSAACNGGLSDDLLCMEEADELLNGSEDE